MPASNGYQEPYVRMHFPNDKTLFRISRNDPEVAGLSARFDIENPGTEWADRVGSAISDSLQLRKVKISWSRSASRSELTTFFTRLANNRSIEHLEVASIDHSLVDIFLILTPFFELNHNLRCIGIIHSSNLSERIPSFIAALRQSKSNRLLERINLTHNDIKDEGLAVLVNALNVMPGLNHLSELCLGFNKIKNQGCNKLATLLKNPVSQIHRLDLQNNFMDDEGINSIVEVLFENGTIKSLNLSSQRLLTSKSWRLLSSFLKSPTCVLETLLIGGDSHIDDTGAKCLGEAFATNGTLKCIDFFGNFTITSFGWQEISRCLRPDLALEELNLSNCAIDDDGAFDIFSALATNSSLKRLDMSLNQSITEHGWIQCFHLMQDYSAPLEELEFSCTNIDDFGANILVDFVANIKGTVRTLGVSHINITTDELRIFDHLLQPSSSSRLQRLCIGSTDEFTNVNSSHEVIKCFAAALSINTCLTSLELSNLYISNAGFVALAKVLCNKTNTIESIYRSNHTLCNISCALELPQILASLLRMNENENKEVVARRKITAHYLSDIDTAGRVFGSMQETILPTAIAWIGQDSHGFSAMFSVVRNMLIKFACE